MFVAMGTLSLEALITLQRLPIWREAFIGFLRKKPPGYIYVIHTSNDELFIITRSA